MERETTRPIPVAWLALLDADRRAAVACTWRAFWRSRLLVWAAGILGVLTLHPDPHALHFDPTSLTAPFGNVVNVLVSPGSRWDSVWYLSIAHDGYQYADRAAFFPLYPLLVRAFGGTGGGTVLAGLAISLVCLGAGLYLVYRLTALELGTETAGVAVALVAFFPGAFALSAVYSESLFLALSAGAFYAARLRRWPWAGALGALGAATRATGVLLIVPLALLYLDRERDGEDHPARRVRPNALWLLAVPLGLLAFMGYLAAIGGHPLQPFQVQGAWHRHFAGPYGALWTGTVAAFDGALQLLSGSDNVIYFTRASGDPFIVAGHNLMLWATLVLAIGAVVCTARRLPRAYLAYVLVALALPLSLPVGPQPLMSLPRFLAVLFPLHMGVAAWAHERGLERRIVPASAGLLAIFSGLFAAWTWVA